MRNFALVAVSIFAVLAGLLGWRAEQQRKLAEQQRVTAEEQRTLAEEQRQQADDILARAGNTIVHLGSFDRMDAKTRQDVFALFQAGAKHGDAGMMFVLGTFYQFGDAVPQDYAKART